MVAWSNLIKECPSVGALPRIGMHIADEVWVAYICTVCRNMCPDSIYKYHTDKKTSLYWIGSWHLNYMTHSVTAKKSRKQHLCFSVTPEFRQRSFHKHIACFFSFCFFNTWDISITGRNSIKPAPNTLGWFLITKVHVYTEKNISKNWYDFERWKRRSIYHGLDLET